MSCSYLDFFVLHVLPHAQLVSRLAVSPNTSKLRTMSRLNSPDWSPMQDKGS